MGALKQQAIAEQEDVDRLVAWYRWHKDKLPASYIQWLLKDDELLWKAIEHWETVPYSPKPASSHVALASNRDHIRRERAYRRDRNLETVVIIGGLLVALAGITFGLIYALEVL